MFPKNFSNQPFTPDNVEAFSHLLHLHTELRAFPTILVDMCKTGGKFVSRGSSNEGGSEGDSQDIEIMFVEIPDKTSKPKLRKCGFDLLKKKRYGSVDPSPSKRMHVSSAKVKEKPLVISSNPTITRSSAKKLVLALVVILSQSTKTVLLASFGIVDGVHAFPALENMILLDFENVLKRQTV